MKAAASGSGGSVSRPLLLPSTVRNVGIGVLVAVAAGVLSALGTPALAQTCVAPPAGMIAWWTLDETSGVIAKDSVGTEPAAYFGSPIQTPGLVAGALKLNGSTDFLSAAQSNLWDFGTSNFTIELWANFAAAPGGSVGEPAAIFIGYDEGNEQRSKWFFAVGGGYIYFHINGPTLGPQFFPLVPFSPTVGVWYHLAVVRSGSTYTIFINGTPAGSAMNASAFPSPNAALTIGQAESLGYMNGLLDEISVYNVALSQATLQAITNAGSAGKCKLPTTTAVSPSTGGDAGQVTVTLSGSLFLPTSTVSLTASGFPSIGGSIPIVSADGTSLTTTFDLTGQPDGVWDVAVSAPGLPTVTLAQAFTIEPAKPPSQVWATVVGRGAIRVGETQEFTLLYGNRGDMDVIGVPIWLSGIPTSAAFTPQFALTLPASVVEGYPPIDPSFPITFTTATDIQVPLIINRIPAGAVGALQFSLLVADTTPLQLVATVYPPLVSFVAVTSASSPAVASPSPRRPLLASSAQGSTSTLSPSSDGVNCLADLAQLALDNLNIAKTQVCAEKIAIAVSTTLSSLGDALSGENNVLPLLEQGTGWAEAGIACRQLPAPPQAKAILTAFGEATATVHTLSDCTAPLSEAIDQETSEFLAVVSLDPNAKFGSQGVTALQYLAGSAPWPYTIAFENDATATAPAQSVSVTDQLDTTNLDLNTFSLGPIGFGNNEVVPPPGLSQFSTYVDLRPATGLLVEVSASLNKTTGIVTWTFNSLDPSTGQAPTNPLLGFLPPDLVPPEGDGQVLFSVLPKSSLSTGQQISNSAAVVFDVNAPVITPAWSNTLDSSSPVSNVLSLPTQSPMYFTVSWRGSDVGSGVKDYTIYVSDNGGPFTTWLTYTTATQAIFLGVEGHSYGFYSIARDLVGNIENSKSAGETGTTVGTTTQFNDVLPTATFFDAANLMFEAGVTTGCVEGSTPETRSFCPNESVTREQMAAFIVRGVTGTTTPAIYNTVHYFTDVPTTNLFFPHIQKLMDLGITTGCATGLFCPADPIPRWEMAIFMIRARLALYGAPFTTATTPYFADVPTSVEGNGVPFPFIQRSYEEHITAGCGTNPLVYCPNELVTRGQMASFIMRGLFDETMVLGPTDGLLTGVTPTTMDATVGSQITVTITGFNTNFQTGDTVTVPSGMLDVSGVVVNSATSISATLTVNGTAVAGPQALVVTSGGQNLTLPLAIKVGTY